MPSPRVMGPGRPHLQAGRPMGPTCHPPLRMSVFHILLGSVWLRGEMEWDGPDSVFWNRMVPISVWLVEWDDPCFLFG